MPNYESVITVTVNKFEAHNDEHAEDIAEIFTRRILDAEICKGSDIKIHVDTFISEDEDYE